MFHALIYLLDKGWHCSSGTESLTLDSQSLPHMFESWSSVLRHMSGYRVTTAPSYSKSQWVRWLYVCREGI